MSIQTVYKRILNLELWHDYYLGQPDQPKELPVSYNISGLMTLVPTSDCLRVLKNLRWIFRAQNQGAVVFANVHQTTSGAFQTHVPIDQPYRLTFWLMVHDRYFANFTNLPLSPIQNQIYYFSNLSGNEGHALFLTQPLPKYNATAEYRLGQLIARRNKTLEALCYKDSSSSTFRAKDWETLPNSQYVSDIDRLPYQTPSRTQIIPNVNPGDTFRLGLVDVNGQETFVFENTAPNYHSSGASISVSLNFSAQIPGRYRLTLNEIEVDEFVLINPMTARNVFGLIEIVLNPTLASPNFALLETSDRQTLIRPKTYVIRFKNRATCWRYRFEKPHGFKQDTIPNDCEWLDDKTYATKRPLGLRLKPATPLKNSKKHLLPTPEVVLIKPEIDDARRVTTIFSDIHL